MKEYCLIKDESGHWYIVAIDERVAAVDYFLDIEEYWANYSSENKFPKAPESLELLNMGYQGLVFSNYRML